jgi:peptidoglycan/LPS O-acetylase OafA/YrhL
MEDVYNFSVTLAAMAVAFGVGALLSRLGPFKALKTRRGRDVTLDGLRGYLALAVVFHHVAVTYTWKTTGVWASSPDVYFLNYGKVGVFLFFMITGYLFTGKLLRAGPARIDWLRLYESRVFRIYPLYLLALAAVSLAVFAASQWRVDVSPVQILADYFKWAVFHGGTINGFADTKIVIAQVDWTLKYEWLFYLALPLVALAFRFRHGMAAMLVICLVLYAVPIEVGQFNSAYLLLFALGGACAWIKQVRPHWKSVAQGREASWLAVATLAAALFYPNTMDAWHVLLIALFFLIISLGNDLFGLLTRSASLALGEISYSIYLLHGIVLYTLFTVWTPLDFDGLPMWQFLLLTPPLTVVVILLSALCYLGIEHPALAFGRRYLVSGWLRERLRGRHGGAAIPPLSGASAPGDFRT